MKTAKDFLEKLQSDEAFAKEAGEKARAMIDAGEKDYKVLWGSIAAEYGYELTDEELDEWYKAASAELSDEELGKVAGGTTPLLAVTSVLVSGISLSVAITYTINTTERPKGEPTPPGEPYGPFD